MEHSIPRSIQREQAPVNDDAIRAAITEQCIRKEPTAAVTLYDQERWQSNFERPWVLPDERYMRTSTEVEGGGGHIFCRACVQPKRHGKLLAFKLHVTVGDDPMKVAKHGIITLECHGCGFEQIVPRKPKIAGKNAAGVYMDEFANLDQSKLEQVMRQSPQFYPGRNIGKSLIGPPPTPLPDYANALSQQHQFLDHMRKLREVGVVDEQRYEEFIAKYKEHARREVDRAVNPPLLGIRKPGDFT